MAFLVNPFLFFYYEEKEERELFSKVGRGNEVQSIQRLAFLAHLRSREMDDWLRHLSRCSHHSRVGRCVGCIC